MMNLLNDIYYSKNYISLYLKPNEKIFEFEYREGEKLFYNISIKRPIEKIGNIVIDDGYFDLETVYGYGGIFINCMDDIFLKKAIEQYRKKCISENIIAEFFRFHPYNNFPKLYQENLDINIYDRDIVMVDLSLCKEDRWNNYSSKVRNILRKCKKELRFEKSSNLDMFLELYKKTMDKNSATDFYYFSNNYFEKLIDNENIELYDVMLGDKVISSAFFMFSSDWAHYHLSANDYTLRQYNANYFILDEVFEIAREKGKKYFLLGGGITNRSNDTLLKFKNKFSDNKKPFYIGGSIYNKEVYNRYINIWEKLSKRDIKYFLKYRLDV